MQTDSIILHKGIAKQFKFKSSNEYAYNAQIAMNSMRNTLYDLIKHNRGDATQKISLGMTEHFSKTADNKRIEDNLYHTSKPITLYSQSSIRRLLDNLVESLYQTQMKNMSNLLGSIGMTTEFIDTIYIKFHEIDPPGVRSFIPTPKQLENKKAVIDPKNNHNICFLYFLRFLYKSNPRRISKKLLEYCKSINISNIKFPPTIQDTDQFEKDNSNISITIFEYGGFSKKTNENEDEDDHEDINTYTNIGSYDDSKSSSINIDTSTNTKNTKKCTK